MLQQPRALPPAHKKTDPAAVRRTRHGVGVENSGDTYSRAFGTTIGSGSLTTVFGMGTGVTFQIWSPEILSRRRKAATKYGVVVIGMRSAERALTCLTGVGR